MSNHVGHLAEAIAHEAAINNVAVKNDGNGSTVDNVERIPDVALHHTGSSLLATRHHYYRGGSCQARFTRYKARFT